ncbi:hypothetical protein LTR56_015630 [Elasticomyces elasticus]|nr:hypothetical protein LTR56_015630 [Elasticomyces elasticus]KAK3652557.1 hypothetical protein LTR22_011644 [Elasticomyces elasticus]KAK4919263.1 hypothetical protein LTR49_013110 [Elasticomyces elasticus]KAK5757820.1 hypothetical protein LTS12_012138 [Elasticomyces elasticus]
MAEQEAKDSAAKTRIITHLNADHHESLVRYLEHYCKLSPWQAYDARMTDITLSNMAFECGGKTYNIPLKPPMDSYRDARERAVQMDKESLQGLGRSDITITEFLPAKGAFAVMFAIICATFVGYSQRWWFGKEQIVELVLGSAFARFSFTIQPYLITFLLVVHTSEMLYMALYKLPSHSVNPRSLLFWKWTATTFIEGVQAFGRFNGLVKAKQDKKAKEKH